MYQELAAERDQIETEGFAPDQAAGTRVRYQQPPKQGHRQEITLDIGLHRQVFLKKCQCANPEAGFRFVVEPVEEAVVPFNKSKGLLFNGKIGYVVHVGTACIELVNQLN
jgi:hypothetical protein